MALVLSLVFILSIISPFIVKKNRLGPIIIALGTTAVLGYFTTFIRPVTKGLTFTFDYTWSPSLAVNFSFLLDGLSLFFSLLILFFGVLVLLYSADYMKKERHSGRFYGYLIFFMGSMLGLVLSANLISIYLFWELTSFSSFLLIGFHNREKKSRKAARQALLVTAAGGLAMLAGFILIGISTGTYDVVELLNGPQITSDHPYIQPIVILILLGAFTKSAQFPFHFWLPNAMEAPTPVSAYLHSSTMVKAGIYLIFRLNPVISSELWQVLLMAAGAITMTMGAIEAFRADDLKRILAYTTISALGIFTMMIGIGSEGTLKAALVYLLAHAFYKGGLFLTAGILDHKCGTRKISELSNIKKRMPYTAAAVILACISMAGIMPFLGFIGKELLYKPLIHGDTLHHAILGLLILSSALFVGIAIKIVYEVFFTKPRAAAHAASEGSALLLAAPLILGISGLLCGLLPEITAKPLLETATQSVLTKPMHLDMSLWHGFNLTFALSLITILIGAGVYRGGRPILNLLDKAKLPFEKTPELLYKSGTAGLEKLAGMQTRFVQNGYLRNYISVYIAVFMLISVFYLFYVQSDSSSVIDFSQVEVINQELIILILVTSTLSFIFKIKSRIIVVAAIGIVGYGIALSYILLSAPDVAITQFLAETLGLILLILIAPKLPGLFSRGFEVKGKYLFISLAFGALMTVITLIGMSEEDYKPIKHYFLENSLSKGKGENVVNVILVDFRALDTLGEISVLTITMIGIISLLKYDTNKNQDL